MKKISVIVIVHNNKRIDICINSILEQLLSEDEIIIVNDHSDANYINTQLKPLLINKQILLYHAKEKRGNRSYNRNLGVQNSKNEILLFLDGDMVISELTLHFFRKAHENNEYVGFLGNAHGLRFSEKNLCLCLGKDNYSQAFQTNENICQLIKNPILEDWRIADLKNPAMEQWFWIYYYTCICSIKRTCFFEIGGFDEAIVTWGSEDIDFGYRLHKYGKIGYVSGAHAVHVPHDRNLWDEQVFDRDNLRYLLDKHNAWPFEMLISFDFSCESYKLMEQIINEIASWKLPDLKAQPIPNSIWINTPSLFCNSNTIVYYDETLNIVSLNLIGIVVPCCDQRFDVAYVSENIFSYPIIIACRILQECLRISKKAILVPVTMTKRKYWDDQSLFCTKEAYRTGYISTDIAEYKFIPMEDGTYRICSPELIHYFQGALSHCPIYVTARSRRLWHEQKKNYSDKFILVNFSNRDTDEIQNKLENILDIRFLNSYSYTLERGKIYLFMDILPVTLSDSKCNFIFICNTLCQFSEKSVQKWLCKRKAHDFILSLDGDLSPLCAKFSIS